MTADAKRIASDKADRALELYDKGFTRSVIAERLGVGINNIGGMLQRAKQRREREAGVE